METGVLGANTDHAQLNVTVVFDRNYDPVIIRRQFMVEKDAPGVTLWYLLAILKNVQVIIIELSLNTGNMIGQFLPIE